jgi:hypothetical protein
MAATTEQKQVEKERFEVRDATGPGWDWLPDWCVVDTQKEIRVSAYDDEETARAHCAELNQQDKETS